MLRATEIDNPTNSALITSVSQLGSALDSATVQSIPIQFFETLDSLPLTNLSIGLQAFVEENKKHYISNGSGWYNTGYVISSSPYWDSGGEPDAEYDIVDSATPLIVIAKSVDSDNPNLINQSFGSDSAQYMATISNDSSVFTFTPKTKTEIGTAVAAGNLTDSNGDFVYTFKWSDGINFVAKSVTIGYSPSGGAAALLSNGDRGLLVGEDNYITTNIQYWSIVSDTSSQSFGNLSSGSEDTGATSNGSRAVAFIGTTGGSGFPTSYSDAIDYWATSTLGNTQDFGNCTTTGNRKNGLSDGVTGLIAGSAGNVTGINNYYGSLNVIDKITIDTPGNAVDFGDMTRYRSGVVTTNDNTYGVFIGGYGTWPSPSGIQDAHDYVTIATSGDATSFGSNHPENYMGSRGVIGDGTYGVWHNGWNETGGNYYTKTIEYMTIQTLSNSSDFGDATYDIRQMQATSNGTHGNFIGGRTDLLSGTSHIEKITIATPSNAVLGSNTLYKGVYQSGACSGAAA